MAASLACHGTRPQTRMGGLLSDAERAPMGTGSAETNTELAEAAGEDAGSDQFRAP
jgi:hypothetical protein